MIREYLCFNCESMWPVPVSDDICIHCPHCGSEEITYDDEEVEDYDGHFEGDMISRGDE